MARLMSTPLDLPSIQVAVLLCDDVAVVVVVVVVVVLSDEFCVLNELQTMMKATALPDETAADAALFHPSSLRLARCALLPPSTVGANNSLLCICIGTKKKKL